MSAGKIWHLSSNRWNSAITEYALSCARATKLLGYETIFTPLAGSPAEQRSQAVGLETASVRGFSLRDLPSLRQMAKTLEPAWVFVYGGPETVASKFLAAKRGTLRFRGHDLKEQLSARPTAFLNRLSHSHVGALLVPSASYGELLQAQGLSLEIVHLVELGLDASRFAPIRSDEVRNELVIFGRLDPIKGHADFAKVYASAKVLWRLSDGAQPFPILHIVGEAANVSGGDLRQAFAAAGLEQSDFRLTLERIQDVGELLSRSLLGVVPSLGSEVICRVAEEFLLCGTPLLVSGVGSLQDLVGVEGVSSYRGASPEQRGQLLIEAIRAAQMEEPVSRLARAKLARERFSLQAMANKLSAVLATS